MSNIGRAVCTMTFLNETFTPLRWELYEGELYAPDDEGNYWKPAQWARFQYDEQLHEQQKQHHEVQLVKNQVGNQVVDQSVFPDS